MSAARALAADARRFREARRFRDAVRLRAASAAWGRPDAVRFVWQRHVLFHDAGRWLAHSLDRPLVLSVHASLVREAEQWGVRRPGWGRLVEWWGEQRILRAADVVACVSDEVAASARELGVARERIVVTTNGIDMQRFERVEADERADDAPRSRLGLADSFVVGWLGSFRSFHALDLLFEAATAAQRDVEGLALLLVGDGPDRQRLEQEARRRGVRAVFTGTVANDDVPAYLRAMDVATIVDSGEHAFHYSPVKLREYMAAGRAIIAPRVGEIPRGIADEEEALLISPGSAEELAGALRRLAADAALRDRLGQAAQRRIATDGSWAARVRAVESRLVELGALTPQA